MNSKEIEKFKQIIYDPYTEAWAVIKTLREADLSKQESWDDYLTKCEEFKEKYGMTEIGGSIYRVMLDAGSEVKRIFDG